MSCKLAAHFLLALATIQVSLAQVKYVNPVATSFMFPNIPSSQLQNIQALLQRPSYSHPRRSLGGYASASSQLPQMAAALSQSKYGSQAALGGGMPPNPASIVAIPLYIRNPPSSMQKNPLIYDILQSSLADMNRKSSVAAASKAYPQYAPKKSLSFESLYAASRPEAMSRYERPAQYASFSKYDQQPKASQSQYDSVRAYDIQKPVSRDPYAEQGSVLSASGYGNSAASMAYPTASYKPAPGGQGQIRLPQVKAVEYDENQKSALADFTSALENFQLKSLQQQDLYDIAQVNPDALAAGQQQQQQSVGYGAESSAYAQRAPKKAVISDDGYQTSYAKPKVAAYEPSQQSYASYAQPSQASYDDKPSYYSSSSSASQGYDKPTQYASSASQAYGSAYEKAYDKYSTDKSSYASPQSYSSAASAYQAPSSSYDRQASASRDYDLSQYAAAAPSSSSVGYGSDVDSYRSQAADGYRSSGATSYTTADYAPASNGYGADSNSYAADSYSNSRPSSSSSQYGSYGVPDPNDPNCPYKQHAASQAAADEYAPAAAPASSYSSAYQSPSSAYQSQSSAYQSPSSAYQSQSSAYQSPSSAYQSPSVAASSKLSVSPSKEASYPTLANMNGALQNYNADEIDPSKLDLKIVHLPVSVLKRLVGSGELALPSYQKKKK